MTSTWRKFSPSRVPPQLRRPWHASKRKQKHGKKHSQSAPVCQPCRLEPSPPQSAAVGLCIATVTGAPVHHSTPNTTSTGTPTAYKLHTAVCITERSRQSPLSPSGSTLPHCSASNRPSVLIHHGPRRCAPSPAAVRPAWTLPKPAPAAAVTTPERNIEAQ